MFAARRLWQSYKYKTDINNGGELGIANLSLRANSKAIARAAVFLLVLSQPLRCHGPWIHVEVDLILQDGKTNGIAIFEMELYNMRTISYCNENKLQKKTKTFSFRIFALESPAPQSHRPGLMNVGSAPTSAACDMTDLSEREERVRDEVEALSAIYGAHAVAFTPSTGILSVVLSEHPRRVSLSCLLPPGYPSVSRPTRVRLDIEGIVRARCESAAGATVRECDVKSDIGECMFQYCQAALEIVENSAEYAPGFDEKEEADAIDEAPISVPGKDFFGDGTRVVHGEPVVEKKSVFQAHAVSVQSTAAARAFPAWLLATFPKLSSGSHHIMAYRVGAAQDCDDDGENAAGKGLLFTLQQMEVDHVVIVVSRWFGGTKLGPARFKLINNAARDLLTHQCPVGCRRTG